MNLFKAILSVGTSRLISAFIAFLISIVVMNELSIADYGDFYFYLSVITLATTFPCIGINNSYIFNADAKLESRFISLKVFIAFVLSVLALILKLLNIINDNLLILCLITGFGLSVFDSHLSNLQLKKKFTAYAFQLPIKNIAILVIAYFSLAAFDSPVYIYAYVSAVVFFVVVITYRRKLTVDFGFSLFSKMAGGFYFFEISSLIMIRSETWWLKYYSDNGHLDDTKLGVYGVAFTICGVISIVANAINSALLPYVKSNPTLLKINNVFKLFLSALACLTIFFALAYFIIKLYFFDKYGEVITYLGPILLGMLFSFIAGFIRLDLVRRGLNNYLSKVYIVQLIGTVVLGGVLIYKFGLLGAVTIFVASRLFVLLMIIYKYDYKNTHHQF